MNSLSKSFSPSPLQARHLTVDENSAGQRVDNFLRKVLKGVPPSFIFRIVRSGEVRVNGKRAEPKTHLNEGDVVRVPPVRTSQTGESGTRTGGKTPSLKLSAMRHMPDMPVVYEDDWLLAVNKPSGVAAHGGSGVSFGAIETLRAKRPEARYLELVHRLDRDTSGVLLIAKKRSALVAAQQLWREGAVSKHYDVLVKGAFRDKKRKVSLPLLRYVRSDGERRVRVDEEGQEAVTIFYQKEVWKMSSAHPNGIESLLPATLLDAELLTGRTHQIRVHLSHLGFPLAGDDKYGDFAWNKSLAAAGLKRLFLHARELSLPHPVTGEPLVLTAPLADELRAFLQKLTNASLVEGEGVRKDKG
jgi:23S rRNA pseudouridine955/2504/2580 synthase